MTFDADGVATINGTARVFLDCRLGPLKEIRVHCRVDGDGIAFKVMDGTDVLATEAHAGDGSTWEWVGVSLSDDTIDSKLSLSIVTGLPQSVDCIIG